MISRNDPCWCGSQKKWKKCHYPNPPQLSSSEISELYLKQYGIILKTPEQIAGIKKACNLSAKILDLLCKKAKKGITTNQLNQIAEEEVKKANAIAATVGYGEPPFPKSICTSLNDVICHGIPDDRPLQEGDILNIDITVIVEGYYGDCSRMVCIGKIDEEKQKVIDISYECLMRSIEICKPGVPLSEIGEVIEEIAQNADCSVVDMFVGHGIGLSFHEPPHVPHHYNRLKIPLAEGMTFTIEPMINGGKRGGDIDPTDGWTARTEDGHPSAQWEHTLLITSQGAEILTPFPEQ